MQRKQPVCRPESQKNSDVVQETKEVSLTRVGICSFHVWNTVATFCLYKLTPYSPHFSFEHLFAVSF